MTDPRNNPKVIDLNCDIGEGFGPYTIGDDQHLLAEVSSANIACGFHAGDPATMRETVRLAMEKNVAIGAHPGLPDRVAFGRRRWDISPQEAYDLVLYQVGALAGFVQAAGGSLRHVKPHGALYNMAAGDFELATAVARAVLDFGPQLILFGLAGSQLIVAGRKLGLRVAGEAFADRAYEKDGSLMSRNSPQSVHRDVDQCVRQVLDIVQHKRVVIGDGAQIGLDAETICIHGDRPNAAEFARSIRQALIANGVKIAPINGI